MSSELLAVHLVPSLDISYGGPAFSVPALANALRRFDISSALVSVERTDCCCRNPLIDEHRLPWLRAQSAPWHFGYLSFDLIRLLMSSPVMADAQIVHLHSFWCFPAIAAHRVARVLGKQLVISPRSEFYDKSLEKNRLLKKAWKWTFGQSIVRDVRFWHATSVEEADTIFDFTSVRPIIVAPNAVDLHVSERLVERSCASRALGIESGRRCILYLGRLHPRKGVDRLLRAWRSSELASAGWDCVIAGAASDPSYERLLRKLGEDTGLGRVHWLGHVEDEQKHLALSACDIFVLPSNFENFGVAIAEALACSRPVITTDRTPWGILQNNDAGRIVAAGDDDGLAAALKELASLSDAERAEMGTRGRRIVETLSWERSAEPIAQSYRWALGQSKDMPPFFLPRGR